MALSPADKAEITKVIQEAVANGSCTCGHSAEVVLFFQRIKALGDGNVERGVESLAKTIFTFTRIRKMGERIGGVIAVYLAKALFLLVLGLIAAGAIARFGR